jgi:tRNA dimethylallyltransferase
LNAGHVLFQDLIIVVSFLVPYVDLVRHSACKVIKKVYLMTQETSMIDLISVLGHTAAGKTAFAAHLAHGLDGEIISADSRQVYRGMDIGTGKDYLDYMVSGKQVPFHLIDILDAGKEYNVYLFKRDFLRTYADIRERKKLPVLCGGTGLYLESVLRNYRLLDVPLDQGLRKELESRSQEELVDMLESYGPLHNITDTDNRKRLVRAIEIAIFQTAQARDPGEERKLFPLVLGIRFDRDSRRARITERLRKRLKEGMVDEVEGLLSAGVSAQKLDYYGLEYRYVGKYLLKELSYEDMFERLNTAIHQFAKRQMTYFRGMERRGIHIHWLEGTLSMEEKLDQALALFHAT